MLINGNCLHAPFADESFHVIVTSPPYWMKREYEELEAPMIFGGKKDCNHEWQAREFYLNGGGAAKKTTESFSMAGEANAQRIKEARLQPTGRGEAEPIADNSAPEGRARNRRVEFLRLE